MNNQPRSLGLALEENISCIFRVFRVFWGLFFLTAERPPPTGASYKESLWISVYTQGSEAAFQEIPRLLLRRSAGTQNQLLQLISPQQFLTYGLFPSRLFPGSLFKSRPFFLGQLHCWSAVRAARPLSCQQRSHTWLILLHYCLAHHLALTVDFLHHHSSECVFPNPEDILLIERGKNPTNEVSVDLQACCRRKNPSPQPDFRQSSACSMNDSSNEHVHKRHKPQATQKHFQNFPFFRTIIKSYRSSDLKHHFHTKSSQVTSLQQSTVHRYTKQGSSRPMEQHKTM